MCFDLQTFWWLNNIASFICHIYSNLDFVTFIDHKKQPYILFKYWLHQFTKTYPSSDINVAGFDKSTSQ